MLVYISVWWTIQVLGINCSEAQSKWGMPSTPRSHGVSNCMSCCLMKRWHFYMLWVMDMINVNINWHGMLAMWVYMKMRFWVTVAEWVKMEMSVITWKANSMNSMSVCVHRNVHVVLPMAMWEWWRYMAFFKIICIWPIIPSEIAVLAFKLTANVLVRLFTVLYRLVIVFAWPMKGIHNVRNRNVPKQPCIAKKVDKSIFAVCG